MKRNSHSFRIRLRSALIVCAMAILFIPSHLPASGATLAQDPNATLPSTKKTAPTKKSAQPPVKKTAPEKKTKPPFRPTNPGIELVKVPPGSFMMGGNGEADEKPVHQVTINSFYIGKYEVTQAQWQAVMDSNPSKFKECGGTCPVESVSWHDTQKFIQQLNEMNDRYMYRLPTEAEWEYACIGGGYGDHAGFLGEDTWFTGNSGLKTHYGWTKGAQCLGIVRHARQRVGMV